MLLNVGKHVINTEMISAIQWEGHNEWWSSEKAAVMLSSGHTVWVFNDGKQGGGYDLLRKWCKGREAELLEKEDA